MTTAIPGFSTPAAGIEAPLEMLAAGHSRIAHQCGVLARLVAHLREHGADDEARRTATAIMLYFDTEALQQHTDEEENLFPALIESMAGSDAVCIHQMIEGLTDDHRALQADWRRLRHVLRQVAAGQPAVLPAADVDAFNCLYERHLKLEDDDLLPMAERLLGDSELAELGRAMRERWGVADVDQQRRQYE